MTHQFLTAFVVGALGLGLACTDAEPVSPSSAPGPERKDFITLDVRIQDFATCASTARLNLHLVGWVQIGAVIPGDSLPFHFEFIYSNAAGETFVWKHTGLERPYRNNDGDLMLSVAGRTGYNGEFGRLLINLTRGVVELLRGNDAFAEDLACAALT